jgi:hypothetical protein
VLRVAGVKVLGGDPLVAQEEAAWLERLEDLTVYVLQLGSCRRKRNINVTCYLASDVTEGCA